MIYWLAISFGADLLIMYMATLWVYYRTRSILTAALFQPILIWLYRIASLLVWEWMT